MKKAETTRLSILEKGFGIIYRNGYQATSVDEIIATTQVTKGAFYYHFKSKEEMGLAMIRELMYPGMYNAMVKPLLESDKPVLEIYSMMKNILLENEFFDVKYGCPAINLTEEMAPLSHSFHKALAQLTTAWKTGIEKSISKGKEAGNIRQDVDPEQVSCFILAGYGGIRIMGKIAGRPCYTMYLKELKNYLESLK
ncbi:TetR family transcriptional regulator [Anseongella ginsenosidimutans]|uniref:TetR family transcriptional regulator n=1 Tax=Anseongella ginsenosidimutans TaxID=496056 RepID=A0A4R3KLJ1_9SPHI|nr:TetR/AcrR family transcriptional regulator [Anseongella ginsenosidimutans]QEC53807.1 TetR/AcrR family transcriptional regulator [Anseongella ginsenosidimutans]TCS84951.1 TetR family transcriptional regulator [Anseongella ginsenosidimutans]